VFLIATTLPTHAAEYYVSTNGNDGASGSFANPFLTIQHGVDELLAGDILNIRSGHYHGYVSITDLNAASNNPAVVSAYSNEIVTLAATEPISSSG